MRQLSVGRGVFSRLVRAFLVYLCIKLHRNLFQISAYYGLIIRAQQETIF